ncbi:cell division protein [Paenibacillus sambharensis]|uniref:Cell division protein n=1 Tax=Paenibacillus sambharensis TaxID=1803190 RepID=A0A2W1LGY8_9BACL|nr:SRPBCC family protein [Paenibacillus sambharensis]PZD97330.1 cell division protein [Paenibacillus sambharensis]
MAYVHKEIFVTAPIEACFDAARNIEIHSQTVWKHTRERAVGGVTAGLIGNGETVTFEARHLGIRQQLQAKVTEYNRPYMFADIMLKGAFKHMTHTHLFKETEGGTIMTDILDFSSPFGIVGRLFDRLVLERYMTSFITYRQVKLKELLEQSIEVK